MAALTTQNLILPTSYAKEIITKVKQKSVLGALTTQEPQLFADEGHIIFTESPKAQYVDEGVAKSSSTAAIESIKKKIFKLQTTVRMTDEVKWANDDNRQEFFTVLIDQMNESITQGIDYGVLHGYNPLAGTTSANLLSIAIANNANVVTATDDVRADIDSLPDALVENFITPNGIALDTVYANELRKQRIELTGAKMFPEVTLNLQPSNFEGLTAVTSANVSGSTLGLNSGVKAIVGDWSKIKWGVVRNISVKPIEYGDPDGLGDLQLYNQIAYRCELVFAIAVIDPKAFTVLKAA